jgi:hypothetical protein
MEAMDNQELMQKAITAADALATNGKLNDAQADKFIDYVIDETGLKNNARVVKFRNDNLNIDKIGVDRRVAQAAAEATAPSGRSGVQTSKVVLSPKELIVAFEISDNFKESNLEGDGAEDHVIKMMATALGNNLEELYIEGDSLGRAAIESDITPGGTGSGTQYIKDSYLALADGWLKKSRSGHVVDMQNANVGSSLFSRMLNAMPSKFKKNRANLRFFSSIELDQNYREKISTRATQKGDSALESTSNLTPFGVPLVPYALFPNAPRVVEHKTLVDAATPAALLHGPVSHVVVLPATLAGVATTKYIEDTDYTVDYALGTVTKKAGGAIADGTSVKITYDAQAQVILTHSNNFIIGVGRDIRIEKDRNIFTRMNQYVITAKVDVQFEETDAIVLARNIGTGV